MKKTVSLVMCGAMVLTSLMITGNNVSAEAGDDIEITYGTASSGEGWTFDGAELVLDGVDIAGGIALSYKGGTPDISIVTKGDSSISGDFMATYDYSEGWGAFAINLTFTAENDAALSIGGIMGGGNNNDIVTVDGAAVTCGWMSIGASGGADSYLVVENGGALTLNSGITMTGIQISDASMLTINATSEELPSNNALDCCNGSETGFSFSMDETSSLILNAGEYAVYSGNSAVQILDSFGAFLPEGAQVLDKGDYKYVVCDADGVPYKELILGAAAPDPVVESHKVYVKTTNSMTTPDVYSVDVTWGAMEFTYSVGGTNDWNAESHSYTDNSTAKWTASGNTVTVTNHSNKAVTATFGFAKDSAITENITGSFDVTSEVLAAGAVNGYDTADYVTSTLTISGALDSAKTALTKIGTVTVAIQ